MSTTTRANCFDASALVKLYVERANQFYHLLHPRRSGRTGKDAEKGAVKSCYRKWADYQINQRQNRHSKAGNPYKELDGLD